MSAVDKILQRLEGVKTTPSGWTARCPAHDDRKPSLSIKKGDDGRVLVHCHAGCTPDSVVARLGLTLADLQPEQRGEWTPYGRAAATYDYVDERGVLLFQVCRTETKQFPCRRPDPGAKSGWKWSLTGARRVLYRLPRVLDAVREGEAVFIVEGERDVHAIEQAGGVATCNPGGAGQWRDEYSEMLRGAARVVVVADKDKAGRDHVQGIRASLNGKVDELLCVEARTGKDAADHLAAGHGLDEFVAGPVGPLTGEAGGDESRNLGWPDPVDEAALHGLAGDFVRLIEPQSEADPVALLAQFLVAFGNVVGRGPHFRAEADRHMLVLFATLVGASSKGRKGSSWSHVFRLFAQVDEEWANKALADGLVSGEGLIWAVRDEAEKLKRLPKKEREKRGNEYETVIEDPGVKDKRLFVIEAEFARILRVLGREGNTLSAVMRSAWDHGNLRSMSKKDPGKATGAHISVITHVTKSELVRYLDKTEAGNGFGNRFLWFCTRRSKCLPDGGEVPEEDLLGLGLAVSEAVEFARTVGEIVRDDEARSLWHQVYPTLSEGKPGLLGAMLGRAEAQVMRLACLYALLDRSKVIGHVHLKAALALWEYSERSARYIFGSALGDKAADRILGALKDSPDGLTRTELRQLFSGHVSKPEIDAALTLLLELGIVHSETVRTDGRPAEKWFALEAARKAQEAPEAPPSRPSDAFRAFRASAPEPEPGDSDALDARAPGSDDDDPDGEVEVLL